MTATDMLNRIALLEMERVEALEVGLHRDPLYMADLEADLAHHRAAYIGLAVTEIATLRAALDGPLQG